MVKIIPGLVRGLLIGVVIIYVMLFALQRPLLFQTAMANAQFGPLRAPETYGLADFKAVDFTAYDGTPIMGWIHPPQAGMPVIIYMHGNAEHLGALPPRFRAFAEAGYGVMGVSWRGYGKSSGSPSEAGLYDDARGALALVKATYPGAPVLLYGESLGSGVAAEIATEYRVAGLVLQSAYTSIPDRVAEIYWFLPGLRYLVRDRFKTLARISALRCPVLILHGSNDRVVPLWHGTKLARVATQADVRSDFVIVPGAGHNDIPDELVVAAMKEFFLAGVDKPSGGAAAPTTGNP